MSHVSTAKAKLKDVNAQMLKDALEILANKIGAKVVDADKIADYYGNKVWDSGKIPVAYGIKGGALNYGAVVGINKEGEVEIFGDFWGSRITANQLNSMVEKEYTVYAVQDSLESLGFTVQEMNENEEEVEIVAEEVGW